ncbi:hypothetical protein Y019_10820 [Alcanivorax sp. 97CO-6]|nr:hypothetical protein Y019_10820 [Alcanivorax sp. 97CO-6]
MLFYDFLVIVFENRAVSGQTLVSNACLTCGSQIGVETCRKPDLRLAHLKEWRATARLIVTGNLREI